MCIVSVLVISEQATLVTKDVMHEVGNWKCLYIKVFADVLWICCDGFIGCFFFIVTFSTVSCID